MKESASCQGLYFPLAPSTAESCPTQPQLLWELYVRLLETCF